MSGERWELVSRGVGHRHQRRRCRRPPTSQHQHEHQQSRSAPRGNRGRISVLRSRGGRGKGGPGGRGGCGAGGAWTGINCLPRSSSTAAQRPSDPSHCSHPGCTSPETERWRRCRRPAPTRSSPPRRWPAVGVSGRGRWVWSGVQTGWRGTKAGCSWHGPAAGGGAPRHPSTPLPPRAPGRGRSRGGCRRRPPGRTGW